MWARMNPETKRSVWRRFFPYGHRWWMVGLEYVNEYDELDLDVYFRWNEVGGSQPEGAD